MKLNKLIIAATMVAGLIGSTLGIHAEDKPADAKAKPYPLKTCVVTDEELGKDADMKPYTFVHKGQEVKLCCKGCLKDFEKEPAKYTKKIEAAQKK